MSVTPSWEHYGTHDDSAYPELWDGLVGAYCPNLGPTGNNHVLPVSRHINGVCVPATANAAIWTTGLLGRPAINLTSGVTTHVYSTTSRINSTNALSVAVWVKYTSQTADFIYYPMCTGPQQSSWGQYHAFGFAAGGAYSNELTRSQSIGIYTSNPTEGCSATTEATKGLLTSWAHLVWCFYKADAWFYVNNKRFAAEANTLSTSSVDATGIWLGQRSDGSWPIKGLLSEALIWSRIISDYEVGHLYGNPLSICTPRRPRRFYSFPGFLAAWARQRNASLIGGGLR